MVKTKLTFNRKPKHKSNCLYNFKNRLEVFEEGNYNFFIRFFNNTSSVRYYKRLPFTYKSRSC